MAAWWRWRRRRLTRRAAAAVELPLAAILSDLVSGLAAVGPLLQLAREVQSSELSNWYQGQGCAALRQPVPTSVAVRRRRWSEVDRHAHYTVSPIFARGFAATTL